MPPGMVTSRPFFALVMVIAACSPGPSAADVAEDALVIAENVGPILAVVSLAPAEAGANNVRLELFAGGDRVQHRARVTLVAGAREVTAADLAPGITLPFAAPPPTRGTLAVPAAGTYELTVSIEGQPGSAVIAVDLPARRPPGELVAAVDRSMNALTGYREQQTLSGGGPVYGFHYQYRAPDRMRYTFSAPGAAPHETIIIGDRRWDRDLGGHENDWVASQGGAPIVVPSFAYGSKHTNVRIIGHEGSGDREMDVIALVDQARGGLPVYYRLWVETRSYRVQRYVMMAFGHYMRGTYTDFGVPLEISAP